MRQNSIAFSVAGVVALTCLSGALAQTPGTGEPSTRNYAARPTETRASTYVPGTVYANPFINPAVNPYLNPYLSTTSMSSDAALLYFLAAQRQTGGVGSGVISGVHAAEMGQTGRDPAPTPTRGPFSGGAANRYFNRGQGQFQGVRAQYFQRTAPRPRS